MQNFYDQLFSDKQKPYYTHLSQVLAVTPKQLTILRQEEVMGWVMWGQEVEVAEEYVQQFSTGLEGNFAV